MWYSKVYDQLIHRAQIENREKGQGVYYERHHITPRSLNGSDEDWNLVLLTANIGRKHTEESKEKIRQTKRNKNAKS